MKTWPVKEVLHNPPDCIRLKNINKHRGKLFPVAVEDGWITWDDREPIPAPEDAITEALGQLEKSWMPSPSNRLNCCRW